MHYHQAPPCKQRPPGPIRGIIYHALTWRDLFSFSSSCTDFARRLLCLTKEDPRGSGFELFALLLLLLPLLFTPLKLLLLLADRHHQNEALDDVQNKTQSRLNYIFVTLFVLFQRTLYQTDLFLYQIHPEFHDIRFKAE